MRKLTDIAALIGRRGAFALAAVGGLLAFAPIPAGAATADALTVTIGVKDVYAPSPVTDLSASPGAEGQMLLQWTAPEDDNFTFTNRRTVAAYEIRIATFSADSVGDAATWWGMAGGVGGEPPPSPPSQADILLINGLTPGATYWAAIRSVDDVGLVSPIDARTSTPGQQPSVVVFMSASPPATPANFTGVALSTASLRWSWDASPGADTYEVRSFPADALIGQTTNTFLIEAALAPNASYARTVRAGNASGPSPPAAAVTIFTLAATPANPAVTGARATEVDLAWDGNGNPAGTRFQVERSTDAIGYATAGVTTDLLYTDAGLTPLTTYHYRVRALNGDDVATAPTAAVSTATVAQGDVIAPAAPLGLEASIDSSHRAFTITWEDVTTNEDETPLLDLAGYHIYRRDTLRGAATRLTPAPINVTAFADRVDGETFYYSVRAIDANGNESGESFLADSSVLANIIFLAPDDKSTVLIPSSVNDVLRSSFNRYGAALSMRFDETPVPSETHIVRNIDIQIAVGNSTHTVNDIAFDKPLAVVSVGYNAVNGQVATGSPNAPSAASGIVTSATPEQLSLFWHNGVRWVKIGGALDEVDEVLKTKSSFVGRFQLRIAASATSLTLNKANVFPRTFTPNGDGFNDRVYFLLENPNDAGVSGEIVDMAGRHVATLPPATTTGIGTTLTWDGKDDGGSVVPGGVYIYRIMGEGKTFTGTVVVAR